MIQTRFAAATAEYYPQNKNTIVNTTILFVTIRKAEHEEITGERCGLKSRH